MATKFNMDEAPGSLYVIGSGGYSWLSVLKKAHWECYQTNDLRQANAQLEKIGPCIGIIDLSQDEFSLTGLANLVSTYKHVRWLAFVKESHINTDTICQFIVNFCMDFFTAPIADQQLLNTIGHQLGMLKLEKRVWPNFGKNIDMSLVFESASMKRLQDQIKRIGSTDVSILIYGEKGTGKDEVAKAIHQVSSRAYKPFKSVSCNMLTDEVFEAEVFGIRNSASYKSDQPCILELVDGGTIVFNNILNLSKAQQQNLLHFLQHNIVETKDGPKKVDVRILATHSTELEKALYDGGFSEELYLYLNVLRISVPSLKERATDIELLANHYLQQFLKDQSLPTKTFSAEAINAMKLYFWPGNLIELKAQIARAALNADDLLIDVKHLDLPYNTDNRRSLKAAREKSEYEALLSVIESHSGQVTCAAKELGISRATMYRLLNKHGLISESIV